jgi:hypothetical protein
MSGSGRLTAVQESERVAVCPHCGASNPDPERGVLCGACGAILPDRLRRFLKLSLAGLAAAAGMLLLGLGATVAAVTGTGPAAVIPLAVVLNVLGGLLLAGAGIATWRIIKDVTAQDAPQAHRFLGNVDKAAIAATAFLVVAGGALAYFVLAAEGRERPRIEAAFAERLAEFQDLASETANTTDTVPASRARLKPKALVLDRGEGLSDVHFDLPDALRAETPEEVASVVALQWQRILFGRYRGTDAVAYRWECQLTVVDAATKEVLARPEPFVGGDPPKSAAATEDVYGTRPVEQIVAYLAALERE